MHICKCTCAHTEYKTCSLPSPTSRRSLQPRSGRSTPPGLEPATNGSANYNDLTATSLGIMVSKGKYPQMALIQVSEIL